MVAVDHRGNVIVCGKTKNWGTGWDLEVIKYNAAGVLQWENRYNCPSSINGTGTGDDVATSIAVDFAMPQGPYAERFHP